MKNISLLVLSIGVMLSPSSSADNVINDDLIVTFSECIGTDCVNGENFGFDTLRLKENNLRIHFMDTSNSGSFPSNDWRIVINDTNNGGANYFAVEDSTANRIPFKVEAGAPANSLFVKSNGNLGVGTATPVVNIHTANGNTPSLRLEQNGSSGFTAQTWDVAGNETNFFIRDITNGSKLPFKIKPGAPTDSIYIAADGKVGLGTPSPSEALHIKRTNDPQIIFDENGSLQDSWTAGLTDSLGNGFSIINAGVAPTTFLGVVLQPDGDIFIHNGSPKVGRWNFQIEKETGKLLLSDDLDVAGNITAQGTISPGSSRATKNNISLIDGHNILKTLANLDIYSWSYIRDAGKIKHIGPMAEDFHSAFSVGVDNKHISPTDTSGISLAAIKALMERLDEQSEKIKTLEKEIDELNKR